jgi:hypothetical protein
MLMGILIGFSAQAAALFIRRLMPNKSRST